MNESFRKEKIKEIKETIQKFAEKDLYSANCEEVKYLYKQLRELENREYEEDDDDYEPIFINGSDVPLGGYYE